MKDIVHRITGDFGIWQLRTVLIIFLCKIPASWFMACVIFTAPELRSYEYYCADDSTHEDQPVAIRGLSSNEHYSHWNQSSNDDHCYKENFNYNTSGNEIVACSKFHYQADYWSVVTQFNLVCSRDIFVAWTQFWHLFGVLSGGILATKLMLLYSPRDVMLSGMIAQLICGCITGLTNDFNVHCAFRYFSAICCALMFTSGQVIFSEITGGKYRLAVNTLFDQFWSIGVILLPGLSSFFASWSHIYLAITFPTVILIVLYPWIPNAPRWLLKRGRIDDVERILLTSASINDRMHTLPENLKDELEMMADSLKSEPPPANWWSLWTGPRAKTHFVAAHVAWAIAVTNFNGMLLNIRSFGRDYLNVNTVVSGFSEIIGCFLALFFALKSTKYKWMCSGVYNIIAGAIGCLGWLIPNDWSETNRVILWMILATIPKIGISISQSMLIAGTSELVPPAKRPIFGFSCIVGARIILLTAPFINVFKVYDTALSLSAFGVLGLIGGIASCFLKSEEINTNATLNTNSEPDAYTDDEVSRNGFPKTLNVWAVDSESLAK